MAGQVFRFRTVMGVGITFFACIRLSLGKKPLNRSIDLRNQDILETADLLRADVFVCMYAVSFVVLLRRNL